ncbi:MAG TPA: hypothetical protein VEU30_06810, partial [Thermoanaerobaculia bacterium]|nr:hypothetical protein [Thermoanaerobaculia bacterium]
MPYQHTAFAAVLALLTLVPAASAQPLGRGEVLLETREHAPWPGPETYSWWLSLPTDTYAGLTAFPLIVPTPRFDGRAPMLAFGGGVFVGDGDTIYRWHDLYTFTPVLEHEHEISDLAPRGGNFLAAERFGGTLIEFNLAGRVREYPFPGGEHIELLSDQCTLLYTGGAGDNRVRRMNLCTGRQLADFALLPDATYAGAIRQLPSGEILVADGNAIRRFSATGSLTASYDFPGVTHIALTARGTRFHAAGVFEGVSALREYAVHQTAPLRTLPLGNPGMQTVLTTEQVTDLTV